jgi:hypothetical protein
VLALTQLLDRESVGHMTLTVAAYSSDRINDNTSITVNITINDVNDNRPEFSQVFIYLVLYTETLTGSNGP